MATLASGPFGYMKGKAGGLVFRKFRKVNTAALYQPDVHDPATPDQLTQRSLFASIMDCFKQIPPEVKDVLSNTHTWSKAGIQQLYGENLKAMF